MKLQIFVLIFLFSWCTNNLYGQITPACTPTFTSGCNGYRIYSFTYAGINNSPAAANCSVANYLGQVATVQPGVATAYSIQMGLWMNYAIYADFNNNGNFNDANEMLYASGAAPPWSANGMLNVSGNLTVPASVPPGSYRLRVLGVWVGPALGPSSACNTFNLAGGGNFHDYTLVVNCPTLPPVPAVNNSSRCGPGTLTLSSTGVAGASIKWYTAPGGGTAIATGASFTTPYISAGTTYYVTAAIGNCESNPRQPVTASVLQLPPVNLGNDTTICPGVSYILSAAMAGAGYVWNTGAVTSSITVNSADTYSVRLTDANGCDNSDTIIIKPASVPIPNLPAITNLCSGNTAALDAGNPGFSYNWSTGATSRILHVTTGGTFAVAIKSQDGCLINSSTDVIIRPLPVVALGNDTNICKGDQITFDAGNPGLNYSWNTGNISQTINVSDSGRYTVTVTTPYGCGNSDSVHVAFIPAPRVQGFNFIPLFYEEMGKVKFLPLNPTNVDHYEWNFGDGSAPSFQTQPIHTYTGNGDYKVTLKVLNDCNDFEVSLWINVSVTGIENISKSIADVLLYPNPAKEQTVVESKNHDISIERIIVFNTLGKAVYDMSYKPTPKSTISINHLPNGIYTLSIITNRGITVKKLNVMR
ncbi:PKD domain-containing protein [Taibaiella chishuiensis]|uniref:Putative secreted protein (Por secretion system target) n=1 Tax=Taibaiella chishuiensis TaxID=1434707 RepID=A0A2P8CT39_9BACT|nr:PKD domain-containing protein [Taibaiella chishuiensis]PSK88134.1 putative secreted protein (Por secretion system target) [Taibaiella chishuiensis]